MEIQYLFSIVFASFICSICVLHVQAATTPDPTESTVETESSTEQSTSAAPVTTSSASETATPSTNGTSETTDGTTVSSTQTDSNSTGTTITPQPSESTSDTPAGVENSTTAETSTASGDNGTGTPETGSTTPPSTSGSTSGTDVPTSATQETSNATVPDATATVASSTVTDANQTSEAVTTTTTTTTTPAVTTQPPLSTKYPSVGANTDVATFTLSLPFTGEDDNPATWCNDSYLLQELTTKLQPTMGYIYMYVQSAGNRKFNAVYRAKILRSMQPNVTVQGIQTVLNTQSDCYNNTDDIFDGTIKGFAAQTTDYCSAKYICPLGYKCQTRNSDPVCTSLCEDLTCENDGICNVVVEKESAKAVCKCVDTYESIYHGDKCELSRMNPERVAAIVGGVLGAVCFILLVALYCMCYRKRENKGKKYNLSGVYNETYDHASLDMKNM